MEIKTFKFEEFELEAVERITGEWLFRAIPVLTECELIAKANHASQWLDNNVPKKWYLEFKIPGKRGRPALYLTEAGLYFTASQSKTDMGYWLRDKIFEEILPSIRKTGTYKSPDMSFGQRLKSVADDISAIAQSPEIQEAVTRGEQAEKRAIEEGQPISREERGKIIAESLSCEQRAGLLMAKALPVIQQAIAHLEAC